MDVGRAFKALDLPENASLDDVKHAWRDLIFIWHPDKHQRNPSAQKRALEKTKEINEAYEFLCNCLASHPRSAYEQPKRDVHEEYTFIVCRNCGVTNRIQERHSYGLRCGRCGAEMSYSGEQQRRKDDWDRRQPCGDGICTGIIGSNGRCTTCGKTLEEGLRAQKDREQSNVGAKQKRTAGQGPDSFEKFMSSITEKTLTAAYKKWRSLRQSRPRFANFVKYAFWCLLTVVFSASFYHYVPSRPIHSTEPWKDYQEKKSGTVPFFKGNIAVPKAVYVRPSLAPNGQPWPSASGYVKGYPKKSAGGLSTVTVDNTQASSDVFVKFFCLDTNRPTPVRFVFIKTGTKFTVGNVRPGNYDIRYKNLDSGSCSKSQHFDLQELQEPDGIQYSTIKMTLYKVPHGNMKTFDISEEEFE